MTDNPTPAKNPARKIQAAKEKIMFEGVAAGEPQRADIFMPGEDNKYGRVGKGGITTRPQKKEPPPKPPAKNKAAGKKIKKKIKKKKLSPAQHSQALAEGVVTSFTDRLIEKAGAKGGYLSVSDLESMNQEFQEKTAELKVALEKSFEDYVTDHERKSWLSSRVRPFDRLIVKYFSHLLEDDSLKIKRSDHVSRRMLPGFFVALNLMLGTDVRESYQAKCQAIVKRVMDRNGEDFDWDDIYDNEDARAISFDALVAIARHFCNLDKRREWFIDLVNSHLPPVASDDDGQGWAFSRQGFDEFFHALMAELRIAVSITAGRALITRRHGAEATAELVELMKKLPPVRKN